MLGRILLNTLFWIPSLLVALLLVIPCSIFFIYRFFITTILRRLISSKLVKPVANQDYGFSTDDIWNNPRSAIAFAHILEGPLDVNLVINRVSDTILRKSEATKYDRLTSVAPFIWFGFPFWKNVKMFDISKHIRVNVESNEGLVDVDEVWMKWLQSPFEIRQPLWDILLIPDFVDKNGLKKALFGFRIHHVIGDGYSMLEFLQKIFDEESQQGILEVNTKQKQQVRRSTAENLEMYFWMPSTIGKHFSDFLFHSDIFSTLKRNRNISLTRITLGLDDLKTIRRNLSESTKIPISFVAVILFIFGGALRNLLLGDSTKNPLARVEVGALKNVNVAIGLPKSTTHPTGTFCNHWAHGVYEIPIRGQSRLKRLREMILKFSRLQKASAFEMNGHFTNLYSILPHCIYSPLLQNLKATTIGMANLPGPSKPVQIFGKTILEKYALLGLQLKNASFTLGCFSYNNQLTISIISNQEVFNDKSGKLLGKYFKEEVSELLTNGIEDGTLVELV